MKKLLVVIAAVGLVLLVVTGAAGARSEATQIQIVATMLAADEVPTPKGEVSSARGSAKPWLYSPILCNFDAAPR